MRVPRFAAVFLFAFSLVVASGVATAPAQAAGYSISRGPNTSNKVILTFDDCPKSLSSFKKTVKAFSDMGVRVALFPTGNCIKAGKFDAKYARKMGHYVFNHSITHPDLRTLSYAGVRGSSASRASSPPTAARRTAPTTRRPRGPMPRWA